MWLFNYFNFERNYNVLKSKSPFLLNKSINFNKTELEIKNPPHTVLKGEPCASAHIRIAN